MFSIENNRRSYCCWSYCVSSPKIWAALGAAASWSDQTRLENSDFHSWIHGRYLTTHLTLSSKVTNKLSTSISQKRLRWVLNLLGQTYFCSISGQNWSALDLEASLEPESCVLVMVHRNFRYVLNYRFYAGFLEKNVGFPFFSKE